MAGHMKNAVPAGLAALLLAACSPQQQPPSGADTPVPGSRAVTSDVLWFEEQEPGVETYPVRVLVTAAHVRIDDNQDDGDYILFERQSATSYTVTHADRTVLEIRSSSTPADLPAELQVGESSSVDSGAPPVAGRQPVLATISANGTVCYQLLRLPGLLQDALAGMAEYARALGNRQLAGMDSLLPEQRTPCLLARYAYAPDRPWTGGIPIRMWDAGGYSRVLVNFSEQDSVSRDLFRLPRGYTVYRMDGSAP